MSDVSANVAAVRERIARAADRVSRDPAGVLLVAAAKTKSPTLIDAAIAAGVTDVGENYVQETERVRSLVGRSPRWHMIGHLQRNKAKRAIELFDVIQTVSSFELGAALSRHSAAQQRRMPVLVEVNLGGEVSKSGVAGEKVAELVAALGELPGISVDGLMTVPPMGAPEDSRPFFRRLRELRDEHGLRELSMGMTDDFEVAVEEGATMVRVGRAIFGDRS